MKEIQGIEFYTGSREELLPGFTPDFPYIASKVDFDKNMGGAVPWHWHRAVELFYMESGEAAKKGNDKIKQMMVYIHEHYQDKITIAELAASAFLSERECFRVFQEYLHMTPIDYIQSYRLQAACQMLARGHETITEISHACGFGSSSYFGKVFREYTYCTPSQYRQRWQDSYK